MNFMIHAIEAINGNACEWFIFFLAFRFCCAAIAAFGRNEIELDLKFSV